MTLDFLVITNPSLYFSLGLPVLESLQIYLELGAQNVAIKHSEDFLKLPSNFDATNLTQITAEV